MLSVDLSSLSRQGALMIFLPGGALSGTAAVSVFAAWRSVLEDTALSCVSSVSLGAAGCSRCLGPACACGCCRRGGGGGGSGGSPELGKQIAAEWSHFRLLLLLLAEWAPGGLWSGTRRAWGAPGVERDGTLVRSVVTGDGSYRGEK